MIGNESCDLDSAVCAISLAYFYSRTKFGNSPDQNVNILPVMNIERNNLPLKTEVTYFLHENKIDVENLICKYNNQCSATFKIQTNKKLIFQR